MPRAGEDPKDWELATKEIEKDGSSWTIRGNISTRISGSGTGFKCGEEKEELEQTQTLRDEIIKLKKEIVEYEAVETFILDLDRRNYDCIEVVKAHYRQGEVVNGKWINECEIE